MRKTKVCLLAITTLCLSYLLLGRDFTLRTHGQSHVIDLHSCDAGAVQWTPDSRSVTWMDNGDQWKSYDTQTGTTSSLDSDPFAPKLPPREANVFALIPPDGNMNDTQQKSYSVSPDGRYLLYARTKHTYLMPAEGGDYNQWAWSLAIGDRKTLTWVETDIELYDVRLDVLWSPSGHSFVINVKALSLGPTYEIPGFLYVTGYSDDLAKYSVDRQFETLTVGGKTYVVDGVYEYSSDRRYILAQGYEKVTQGDYAPGYSEYPIIYDLRDKSNSKILPINVNDAQHLGGVHFLHGKPDQILMTWGDQGLVLYDVAAQTRAVLNNGFAVKNVPYVWFSPDDGWIAYVNVGGCLYLTRLEYVDLIGALKATPTTTNTSSP